MATTSPGTNPYGMPNGAYAQNSPFTEPPAASPPPSAPAAPPAPPGAINAGSPMAPNGQPNMQKQAVTGALGGAPPPAAPAAPGAALSSGGIQPYQPVNGPLQLIGFSPQNHLGETPTVTTPKYAVSNTIQNLAQQQGFDPLNFASTAADQLNKQFGTQQFQAKDGQTLLYGDEYVHTAPAGYGPGGDPNGGEELVWGSTNQGSPQQNALQSSLSSDNTGSDMVSAVMKKLATQQALSNGSQQQPQSQ